MIYISKALLKHSSALFFCVIYSFFGPTDRRVGKGTICL